MSNGIGGTIYFGTNVAIAGGFTGSVLNWEYGKSGAKKVVVDGNGYIPYVGLTERMRHLSAKVVLSGSGSLFTTPEILDSFTVTSTAAASTELTGNWAVTSVKVAFTYNDATFLDVEGEQYYKNSTTTIP